MSLLTRIVREVKRYGAPCAGSLLSAFQKAARVYTPRPEEAVGTDRQRHFGNRVWERHRRAPHGNAHLALALKLLAVFAICAAAGSAVLLTVDETTTASSPGNSAEAGVRAGIHTHPLQSYEGPPTATSGLSLPPAISGAHRANSGPKSQARTRLPAHVMPAAEPPELLALLDVPLAPDERTASVIPVLAAILPAAAEINRGLRLALAARPLNTAPAMPTPPLKSADWRSRTAPSDERGPMRAPPNPLLAAVQPGSAAAPGPTWGSAPLVSRTALQAPHAGRLGRNPAGGPERNAVMRVPPVATLAAVHPNQVNIFPKPLNKRGASVLNSPWRIRAPDGFPGDQDWRIQRPDGPASLPLQPEPLLLAIRPNRIEVGRRPLDAIGSSALNSPLPLSAMDAVPSGQDEQIAQPQRPALLLLRRYPLLAAIQPSQAQLAQFSHKQLEVPAHTPIAAPATQRVPQAHSDRRSWPGNGAPGEPSSARWRPDAVLAAVQPSNATVRHEMRSEGDTGFLSTPPAPRPLLLATGKFPRGGSQNPRDAVPLAPDPAVTANYPVAMQVDREAEIVPGTGPASAPAAPFGPLLSSPERRSHGSPPEPPSTAESIPGLVLAAPAAFTGRHVQRVPIANAAVKAAPKELPGALRAPLAAPENPLSQNVRSAVPESVPKLPGASPVQAPVATALRGFEPSPEPLLSSRLPALPPAYGLGDGAASEALEAGTEIGHESANAPMLPLVRHTIEVAKGNSLLTILDTHAVPPSASLNAIARLRPRLDPKRIKAGDRVSFVLVELEGAITVMELAVARIGGSERHHYWGSRTFEPGEVVEFGNIGDGAPEEGESGPAARDSLAEEPAAGDAPVAEAGEVPLYRHTMTVRPGDSLLGILQSNEVPAGDALVAIRGMKPKFSPSRLQIGDRVSFVIDSPRQSDQEKAESRVLELSIAPKGESGSVHLWSSGENFSDRALLEIVDGIAGLEAPALALAELILVEGQIAASFYRAAEQAGVSPGEIRELVRILSGQINFPPRHPERGPVRGVVAPPAGWTCEDPVRGSAQRIPQP